MGVKILLLWGSEQKIEAYSRFPAPEKNSLKYFVLDLTKLSDLSGFARKMKDLHEVLKKGKYKKIPFKVTKTQHLLLKARINGIRGNFILDTGASNSCVGFEGIELFALTASKSATKAAGAGATGMFTQLAKDNVLQIGRWKCSRFHLVVFDLSHVNEALRQHKAKPVQGIIGADVLLQGQGIIDYYNHCLYLK